MTSKKIVIGGAALLFALNLPTLGYCQQRQDILQMVKISGVEDALRKGANMYRDEVKKNYPKASPSFYRALDADLNNYVKEMKEYYINLYSKKFTSEDIKYMLSFLSTPTGKKFAAFSNEVLPEVAQVATTKTNKIDENLEKRLKKENHP
jgi:hypothetical protein